MSASKTVGGPTGDYPYFGAVQLAKPYTDKKGDQSPFKPNQRNETVLYTSFTSEDMVKVVGAKDLEKLIAIFSSVNPNTKSIADPNAPLRFALGQLELFRVAEKGNAQAAVRVEPVSAVTNAQPKSALPVKK